MLFGELSQRQVANVDVRNSWLAGAIRRGRVCVVCGAGISLGYGVPSWGQLIRSIGGKRMLDSSDGDTWESKLENFVLLKYGGNRRAFFGRVKKVLYSKRKEQWHEFGVRPDMDAIAMLCLNLRRHHQVDIISFNYDSYLEEFLGRRGLKTRPYTDPDIIYPDADVVVSHPHGYLPYGGDLENSKQHVVLDESTYLMSRMSGWWPTCEKVMKNNLCLFVGLSARCPNLNFLMERIYQGRGGGCWGIALTKTGDRLTASKWAKRGVCAVGVGAEFERTAQTIVDFLDGSVRAL